MPGATYFVNPRISDWPEWCNSFANPMTFLCRLIQIPSNPRDARNPAQPGCPAGQENNYGLFDLSYKDVWIQHRKLMIIALLNGVGTEGDERMMMMALARDLQTDEHRYHKAKHHADHEWILGQLLGQAGYGPVYTSEDVHEQDLSYPFMGLPVYYQLLSPMPGQWLGHVYQSLSHFQLANFFVTGGMKCIIQIPISSFTMSWLTSCKYTSTLPVNLALTSEFPRYLVDLSSVFFKGHGGSAPVLEDSPCIQALRIWRGAPQTPAPPVSLPVVWSQKDNQVRLVKDCKTPRWLVGNIKSNGFFLKMGKGAKVKLGAISTKKGRDEVNQH
ncbi:hypothetical protein N7510_011391 [Penicillium lagena]|uniref:uncharacterized protein n=1 Tax=Penicillium lagena TaxID=94218 RepID=UPI00253F7BA6|nr:uncharacterized protein N7510_011391 [Penicillium lagena]KAJ5601857.1 hypothetical protein N7510_011391 [Penicillium lagena]